MSLKSRNSPAAGKVGGRNKQELRRPKGEVGVGDLHKPAPCNNTDGSSQSDLGIGEGVFDCYKDSI